MTPDWSEKPQAVPYADFADPQTLNLYSYGRNNPLNWTDPDGHLPVWVAVVAVVAGAALIAHGIRQSIKYLNEERVPAQNRAFKQLADCLAANTCKGGEEKAVTKETMRVVGAGAIEGIKDTLLPIGGAPKSAVDVVVDTVGGKVIDKMAEKMTDSAVREDKKNQTEEVTESTDPCKEQPGFDPPSNCR